MTDENKTYQEPETGVAAEPAEKAPTADKSKKFRFFALAGIILAVIAWIVLSFDGRVALGICIASFICSCIGLKAKNRTWRNTGITALIASSVLMVVLSAFLIVIFIGLNSI